MGLCAGRKRGRTENNGKQLHDAPKSRARAQRRANANEASFDIDVRSSGTAAGKHFVPRLPNPTRKGRNPIGAEQVKRKLLRHHSRDFMSVLSLSHIRRWKQSIVPLCSDVGSAVPSASQDQWSRPKFVAIGWQYLRSYFRLPEPHIAARQNRLPAISWKPSRNDWQSHFSGDAFSALATPPASARWHRAMLTPLASHPWPLRVQFRVAARQNRRRDRLAPTRAHR